MRAASAPAASVAPRRPSPSFSSNADHAPQPVRHEGTQSPQKSRQPTEFDKPSSAQPRAVQPPPSQPRATQPSASQPSADSAEPTTLAGPNPALPSPEEASNHPLVKAVLEVFEGSVKQVYPRK